MKHECEHEWKDVEYNETREIAGLKFMIRGVPAKRCTKCGEMRFDQSVLETCDLIVARRLAEEGSKHPQAVKFIRRVMGISAKEFAAWIGVSAEMLSRWETGSLKINRSAYLVLQMLIKQEPDEREKIIESLKVVREKPKVSRAPRVQSLSFAHC